ncbi:MAG: tetratricopeptide repeat protein [Myxococcales bacterium]|nr:tetratricopeptide repeat protein [Myxococcales bacterium]
MSASDFVTRGQALVASGQFQEAVKVCRLGLLGRPTTVEGRIVLGQALLALKRYDEVLAEMRVALELDHGSVSAQALKAEALMRKGDHHAAGEVIDKLRPQASGDGRIAQLLADYDKGGARRPAISASHPAVGFVGGDASESFTKHYPNHGAEEEVTGSDPDDESEVGTFTKPTSLQAPTSKKRSKRQQAVGGVDEERLPSAAELAVGDRSGTVEFDPDVDGVEDDDDDDFGAVAAPPPASRPRAVVSPPFEEARGSVKRATKGANPAPVRRVKEISNVSSVELDSDDLVEVDDGPRRPSQSAVRQAVRIPAGPLSDDIPPALPPPFPAMGADYGSPPQAPMPQSFGGPQQPAPFPLPAPTPASIRQTQVAQPIAPPSQANPNHARQLIAASMPTAAAMQPPSPQALANAARPTMAVNLSAAQQQSAAAVDALFGAEQPGWAKQTVAAQRAAANEPTARPGQELDPRVLAVASPVPATPPPNMFPETSTASGKPLKTGVRKGRSKLAIVMWILVGAIVIGGGVFAGFQIRAMRLKKQIAAARDQAVDLAKADTWQGWSGARDRLASIAQASGTVDNRSALARARGVLAFEFGDNLAEAKAAVDRLAGQTNLDVSIARAYVALAQTDPTAAKEAAAKAIELAPNDPAALYVMGQAELLAGEYKNAIASLRSAQEKEPRPLYAVGLARAYAATGAWDDALAAVDRALGQMPDHPGALLERAFLSVAGGRIAPGNTVTAEVRAQLVKLTAEGAKPLAEQQRGVSPLQVALANLALAQVDFSLRDMQAALNDIRAASDVRADEQRFGEEATDTLLMIGELQRAKAVAMSALATWPGSRRARISQAQVSIALGKPAEALEILTRNPDAAALPRGVAVRGIAKLALGDLDGAKADFDAALKKLPKLELAVVGRSWIDLAAGELEDARKRLEPGFNPNTSSVAVTTVWAATLRMGGDPAEREQAKVLLEKVTKDAPPTPEIARAQLELGRVLRDLGQMAPARTAFAEAIRMGNSEARLDTGLLLIEDQDPSGGRDQIDAILKEAGEGASASLLLDGARARMLAGDNAGAAALLDRADKAPNVVRWQYDRERGRLALRRGDVPGAAQALSRALDTCGSDHETFLLAADTVSADPKQAQLAGKLKTLTPLRLKDLPESLIVSGKLALVEGKQADAEKAYNKASEAFGKIAATRRRVAQAHFGLAALFYEREDYPNAQNQLVFVLTSDPSLYPAYLFAGAVEVELVGAKAEGKAFELAKKSVVVNPDYIDGWVQVGMYASKLGKKKELDEAITRVGALAPGSESLATLQALKK